MLRAALLDRLRKLVDPSGSLDEIREYYSEIGDIRKLSLYIGAGDYEHVLQTLQETKDKLRTIRDLIDGFGTQEKGVRKLRMGLLPTADGLKIPSIPDLHGQLVALERNFPEVNILPEGLRVVTEPITLPETDGYGPLELGPMEVVLDLLAYRKRERFMYRVNAIEPKWSVDGDYFHPHVSSYALCEGDAAAVIKRALDEGRFYDFFHIVNNTLINYNGGSPYCEYRRWFDEGYSCDNCGDSMSEDDSFRCNNCDDLYCDSCIRYCERGGEYFCEGCIDNGLRCRCSSIGEDGCLDHENEPCALCDEAPSDDELIECDNGETFHGHCINSANELPSVCEGCDCIEDCGYLPVSLKPEPEEEEEEEEEDVKVEAEEGC